MTSFKVWQNIKSVVFIFMIGMDHKCTLIVIAYLTYHSIYSKDNNHTSEIKHFQSIAFCDSRDL